MTKQFTITVSKCDECPFALNAYTEEYAECAHPDVVSDSLYAQNKNGITSSCPMWPQTVDAE